MKLVCYLDNTTVMTADQVEESDDAIIINFYKNKSIFGSKLCLDIYLTC